MHARLAPVLLASILVTGCFEPSPEAQLDKARQFLAKHDNNAAIVAIKSALQAAPQSAAGRYLFGEALLASGDAPAAEVELRKALELKYPEEQVVPPLARALLRQGRLTELIDNLGNTELQSAAARADLKTSVANAYALQGLAPDAEAALDAALKAQPDYVPAQVMRLRLDMGKRDVLAAQKGLAELLEKHPGDASVWKLKGDFARSVNPDAEAALSAYRKAIELDPTDLDAHSDAMVLLFDKGDLDAVASQLAKMKAVAGKLPQTLFFEARLDFRRGNLAATRAALQQVLRRAPDYAPALELAGATELGLGATAQARAFLTKAIQSSPQRAVARRLLAQSLLASGDADTALTTLQPLLAVNDARSLSLAGDAYVVKGQFDQASKLYARAIKLNPDDVRSRTALAAAEVQRGDVDKGLTELAAISAVDRGSKADLAIAIANLASGKFAPALAAIDVIEKKQPKEPFAANLRGRALLMKGDKPAARASFEKALAIRASYYPAASNLAAMDLADQHPEDAKRRFTTLLAADPKSVPALLALERILARTDAPDAERLKLIEDAIKADAADAKPRIRLVEYYLQRKDAPKAMDAARNAAAALPDNVEIQEILGQAQLKAGEVNQSLTTFTRLAAAQPNSAQAYFSLAEAQRAARNDDGARQSLKKALALAPDSLRAYERLVELEVGAKRYPEALAAAKELQRRQPKARPGYLLEGDVMLAQRNVPAALKAYQTALAVEPSSTAASRVHSAMLSAGHRAEADQFADGWMKKHPKDGSFLAYLGDGALLRQDLAQAEKFYREAIQATPDHAIALNNLAMTLYRENKPGGLEFAQRADKVSPNEPALMDTLAYLLSADGQHQRAIDLQKRAIALEPKNNLLRLTLARIYLKAGKDSLAETELTELARLGDGFPGQQTVTELLKVARKAPAGAASASAG